LRDIRIGAAQFEHRNADKNYKLIAKHRKLHAFINKHLVNGNEYCVFELGGAKFGILTCFDNNLIENVRITTLMGAEVIFMPHVTCCLPSPMPGRGLVDKRLTFCFPHHINFSNSVNHPKR